MPMTDAQIRALQHHVGAVPDGFWGPRSAAAAQQHLRRLMPHPHPFPAPTEAALRAFYGQPGDESRLRAIDVSGLGMLYDGKPVRSVRCHQRVADSLLAILREIAGAPHAWVLEQFAGVYENRPMRSGTRPSLHAYGAAIDLAPATNGLRKHWPMASTMPFPVMEIFARHGWLSAGAFWARDAMHHQATC